MTRGRALVLALLASGLLLFWFPNGSRAAEPAPRPGIVFVFIEDRVSFEQIVGGAFPAFPELARSGGAALMATDENYRSNLLDVYKALGAGAAPRNAVANLLVKVLSAHGVSVCAPADAAAADARLLIGAVPSPQCPRPTASALVVDNDTRLIALDEKAGPNNPPIPAEDRAQVIDKAADTAARTYRTFSPRTRVLVLVVTPTPSTYAADYGDEVTPFIMAVGGPGQPLPSGPIRALTSDTTRRDGLVANVDVAPTILQFFGIPIPSEMDGQPIRIDGHVDLFALHRLHLEQRRIRFPLQMAEIGFVSMLGIVGIPFLIVLWRQGRLSPTVATGLRYLMLCGAAFGIVLLAGGLLPRLTWAVVIPYTVLATAGLAAASLVVRRRGVMAPFVFIGTVGLAFVLVEEAIGGRALGMPLLGGTMFDGVRFYGLPNAFIPILLASALFVATVLSPMAGAVLLFAVGLLEGFPRFGADIGGAITLFAAAGLWWGFRVDGRPQDEHWWRRWLRIALIALTTIVVGLAIVLLANRFLPGAPTHATRFVERATSRFGSALSEVRHRLGVGWHMLLKTPAALIPLVGLVVVFVLVVAAPGPIGRGLSRFLPWREVLVALVIAAAVAFVANDTGVAASAPAFLYAGTLIAYIAFRPEAWAHPPTTPTDPPAVTAREPQGIT